MPAVVQEMVTILVSAISSIGTGIASGIGDTLKALFVTGSGTTESPYALSTTGQVIVAFGAIALGLGICRLCVGFVFGLGKGRL